MATYAVNPDAVAYARHLVDARRYVVRSGLTEDPGDELATHDLLQCLDEARA